MKALVVKSTGSWYRVKLEDGRQVDARVRGKLRTYGLKSTNPVAVGDHVEVRENGGDWTVDDLLERTNYIIRKSSNLSKQTHIVAANIDLCLVLATINNPKLKLGFVDRMLVTAEAYDIPVRIVFNKTDLLTEAERAYLQELCAAYAKVGYESSEISVADGSGLDGLRDLINGKVCLIAGQSGVGKSSLLNALNPELHTRVSDVSEFNEKGRHTTTFAELFEINSSTYVIDTPGLKTFGLTGMDEFEIKDYFPEMVRISSSCKFHNCLHLTEPGCAVRQAYEAGTLPWFRYEHYQYLFEEAKSANTP